MEWVVRQLGSGWMQGRPVLCVGNLKWHCHLHRHSRVSTGKWPGGGGHKQTAWVQLLMGVLWECLLPCPGTLGYRGNCSPLCWQKGVNGPMKSWMLVQILREGKRPPQWFVVQATHSGLSGSLLNSSYTTEILTTVNEFTLTLDTARERITELENRWMMSRQYRNQPHEEGGGMGSPNTHGPYGSQRERK